MLLLESNRVVSVSRLVDAIWANEPPSTARSQIQICISSLRSVLAANGVPATISTQSPGYQLEVAPEEVDQFVFERHIGSARRAAGAGRLADAVEAYGAALDLWRGEPFEQTASPVLRTVATALAERRLSAVEEHVELRIRLHQHHDVVEGLTELVDRNPLRERLRAQLMLALFRCGRRVDALEVYHTGRRVLIDEIGLEPGEHLRRMERAILNDDPDLKVGSGVGGLERSERATPPRMLPAALPDFTGHDTTRKALRAQLLNENGGPGQARMVAISGRGGVGKSSLAIQLAHSLTTAFPEGQLYAHMHGGTDEPAQPAEVLRRFLTALGVISNLPDSLEERVERFRARTADKRVIIVLDDVLDEEQVRPLLPPSPGCGVIISSRRRLTGLSGLIPIELDALPLDQSLAMLTKILDRERIDDERPAAEDLVRLCGGLPLALRVAGARLAARPHWSIANLVERVSDERRQLNELTHGGLDVRASLALSYRTLSNSAQRLFRRLSQAYSNDFAGWICAPLAATDSMTAGDLLDELVDARLVELDRGRGRHARFKLHELVRAYARERLHDEESESDRQRTTARLVGAWLYLAEQAHRAEYGGDHTLVHGDAERWEVPPPVVGDVLADPMTWYSLERSGLLAAVHAAADQGLHDLCWDLALASVTLFENRHYFADWRQTHEWAMRSVDGAGNALGRAAMLNSLGALAICEQRPADALTLLVEAGDSFREIGHDHGYGLALRNIAYLHRISGDLEAAEAEFVQALALLRAAGDRAAEAHVLSNLAQVALERGDTETAASELKLALAAAEETGARRVRAQVLCRLGDLKLMTNEPADAQVCFHEALDLVLVLQDQVGEAFARHGLGTALMQAGDTAEAEALLAEASALAVELDETFIDARISLTIGELHERLGRLPQALHAVTRALGLFRQLGATTWLRQAGTLRDRIAEAAAAPPARERPVWVPPLRP